jgi:hypothetical protein
MTKKEILDLIDKCKWARATYPDGHVQIEKINEHIKELEKRIHPAFGIENQLDCKRKPIE